MKTILYINEDRVLKSIDVIQIGAFSKIVPTENYLIVGYFVDFMYQSPDTSASLAQLPLTPIERYLMTSTNVDFKILPTEFRTANVPLYLGNVPDTTEFPKFLPTQPIEFRYGEGEAFFIAESLYNFLNSSLNEMEWWASWDNGLNYEFLDVLGLFTDQDTFQKYVNLGSITFNHGGLPPNRVYIKDLVTGNRSEIFTPWVQ